MQGRLLDALEEVVDAVRVDGRLEVVEQLVLVVAQRPQELPLLVLGLDVRLALGPEEERNCSRRSGHYSLARYLECGCEMPI